ncbi:tetratricopeptide repeat protein [Alkalihalobacillus trypoxylicola]|uniref:Uncharacterized protein n=1 Tax=Alkalihalobacillus trypoxylicola TaxID=519424 RepID=A0A161PBE7_9BACI|nr:hypothetical protein [Alkalihalobacillus trypoxylicola]KYG29562.1 hypothetical protein AZF04_08575 [Alkalihalobacillus trypoxylicola]
MSSDYSYSYRGKVNLIKLYHSRGESDRAKAEAEEVIRDTPESPIGYALMTFHYQHLNQEEEIFYWLHESLRVGPESDISIGLALKIYRLYQYNVQARKELLDIALRLYPNEHDFHIEAAYLYIFLLDFKKADMHFEEAIKLQPHNAEYLGFYTVFLHYHLKDKQKARTYEQLAFQADPNHNLLRFAELAYEENKFNKARLFVENAMEINPEDENVRYSYEKIYPTINRFVRFKHRLNRFLIPVVRIPSSWIFKLSKGKWNIPMIVLLIEIISMYLIFKNHFLVIFGLFLLLSIASMTISQKVLKKAGFSKHDKRDMESKTDLERRSKFREIERTLSNKESDNRDKSELVKKEKPKSLTPEELEAQLAEIWNSDNLNDIKESTQQKLKDIAPDTSVDTFEVTNLSEEDTSSKEIGEITNSPDSDSKVFSSNEEAVISVEKNETQQKSNSTIMEYPKESSNWPVYLLMIGISLALIARFVPTFTEQINRPQPVSSELVESIQESREQINQEEQLSTMEAHSETIEQFMAALEASDLERALQYVTAEYQDVILAKSEHPLLERLADSQISVISQQEMGLPIFNFLLVNDTENVNIILEVFNGKIMNMHAEEWSETEEELSEYQDRLEQIQD